VGDGAGLTIRLAVNPLAREGHDFKRVGNSSDGYLVFTNKKALTVIPEALHFNFEDLRRFADHREKWKVDESDQGLLERVKRQLHFAKVHDELTRLAQSRSQEDLRSLKETLKAFQNPSVFQFISKKVVILGVQSVYEYVAPMKESAQEFDVLKYMNVVSTSLKMLEAGKLLKRENFIQDLEKIMERQKNFSLRKEALIEFLFHNIENFDSYQNLEKVIKKSFSEEEFTTILKEMRTWHQSSDLRKEKVAFELYQKWSEAVKEGDLKQIKSFVQSHFFGIHFKNISQVSILQLAAYYKQNGIISWLISESQFDFNKKNTLGFTEVEQLKLSGRDILARAIEKIRPEAQGRSFLIQERNIHDRTEEYPEGTPIVDFVRIEPGSFFMGSGSKKVLTTLSKPFEILSVDVTQQMYRGVVELMKEVLQREEFSQIEESPSVFEGDNRPVEKVSHDDVTLWLQGLNELSKKEDPRIQKRLREILPRHQRGQIYNRGTSAQWEFVFRLGGVAEGSYAHGHRDADLMQYQITGRDLLRGLQYLSAKANSAKTDSTKGDSTKADSSKEENFSASEYLDVLSKTRSVGSKKPVFYNGKPLYDLQGNVFKWTENWSSHGDDSTAQGGLDPQGPPSGFSRVTCGGCYHVLTPTLKLGEFASSHPSVRSEFVGFRLIRTLQ
jgi:formylglycine-generating enzyme required for sulfatase activity